MKNKELLIDWIKHPHIFYPRKYWRLELTSYVIGGWIIIIIGHSEGW